MLRYERWPIKGQQSDKEFCRLPETLRRLVVRCALNVGIRSRPINGKRCVVTALTKLVLYTDRDGRAQFREEQVPLDSGTPQTMLSATFPSSGYQLRHSPVGFRSQIPLHAEAAVGFRPRRRNGDRAAGRQLAGPQAGWPLLRGRRPSARRHVRSQGPRALERSAWRERTRHAVRLVKRRR